MPFFCGEGGGVKTTSRHPPASSPLHPGVMVSVWFSSTIDRLWENSELYTPRDIAVTVPAMGALVLFMVTSSSATGVSRGKKGLDPFTA